MKAIIKETCEILAPQRKIELAIEEAELKANPLPRRLPKSGDYTSRGRYTPDSEEGYGFMSETA